MVAVVSAIVTATFITMTPELMGISTIIVFCILSIIYIVAVTVCLLPYVTAATAVFYREICREKYANNSFMDRTVDYIYESIPEKKDFEYTEL